MVNLKPLPEAPKSATSGDMYFDNSGALCVYVEGGWSKITGKGTCTLPFSCPTGNLAGHYATVNNGDGTCTITFQGPEVTEDASMSNVPIYWTPEYKTYNYGGSKRIHLGGAHTANWHYRRFLIKPDLPGVSPIDQRNIVSANLHLYSYNSGYDHTVEIYKMRRPWGEGIHDAQIATAGESAWNYSQYPTGWGTAGANNTATDRYATAENSMTAIADIRGWVTLDVTDAIREFIDGSVQNNGFLAKGNWESAHISGKPYTWIEFYSSEYEGEILRPRLVVTYVASQGVPAFSLIGPRSGDTADVAYTIQWTDSAPNADVRISLYYDTDNAGQDGALIVKDLSEDDESDAFYWDTSGIPAGKYYLYGVLNDDVNQPIVRYSAGPLTINHQNQGWSGARKLLAGDGDKGTYFGHAVSVAGDYAIVGTVLDDGKSIDSGSAYIFKRSGDSWVQQAKLVASDGVTGDRFGYTVAIAGDYAVVGAYGDDDKGTDSGSAYIFARSGNTWTQQAKLLASDGYTYDYFGHAVSISGDYAIVGAAFNEPRIFSGGFGESGLAYIFKRDGASWVEQKKLIVSDANDQFGYAVSIAGDYAIVGARYDDNGSGSGLVYDAGSVYIFARNGETWSQQAKLLASDGAQSDYFGCSVSIAGDYAIVGAINDDDKGDDSGSAYIFKRNGTSWTQQAKLLASDGKADDWFGHSVSIAGDYAVVGAGWHDNGGIIDAGSAYLFKRDGTSWVEQKKLLATTGGSESDHFGSAVSPCVRIVIR
uniref:Disaggregatase related repeat-containing protein n=1 Tax=Candidatus Kentrum sp. LPFa TaxID=2126335 RepID=A0A450Y101_9GAMM|nr:MAG: Disaggregatase related repeat-containing protein [Candidatus Kentron sp. LPFa]VFK35211.1 MAG: Disaggregatase related repeat-containing protein [Candidatus Kentron sp. LPFa]